MLTLTRAALVLFVGLAILAAGIASFGLLHLFKSGSRREANSRLTRYFLLVLGFMLLIVSGFTDTAASASNDYSTLVAIAIIAASGALLCFLPSLLKPPIIARMLSGAGILMCLIVVANAISRIPAL